MQSLRSLVCVALLAVAAAATLWLFLGWLQRGEQVRACIASPGSVEVLFGACAPRSAP